MIFLTTLHPLSAESVVVRHNKPLPRLARIFDRLHWRIEKRLQSCASQPLPSPVPRGTRCGATTMALLDLHLPFVIHHVLVRAVLKILNYIGSSPGLGKQDSINPVGGRHTNKPSIRGYSALTHREKR